MKRTISGIYEQGDSVGGNLYATRKGRSRKLKPAPVTVLRPVERTLGGYTFKALAPVNVIKSPRTKRLDKQDRAWYACLSK
jgi:hypothetical protein